MTVNDDASIANKFETSLTDGARVIIYNVHMFIVHATGVIVMKFFNCDNQARAFVHVKPLQPSLIFVSNTRVKRCFTGVGSGLNHKY